MSEFIEEILSDDRLNPNSNLSNPDSDGYQILDNTIGWWMDEVDNQDRLLQLFISYASGEYLDVQGSIKGIYRKENESDDEFRERIISTQNFHLTKNCIRDIGGEVYCYVENINTQITSQNVLLSNEYIIDINDKSVLENYINNHLWHFVNERDIGDV